MTINVVTFHKGKHLLLVYFHPFRPISRGSKHEHYSTDFDRIFRDVDMNNAIVLLINMGVFFQREELMDMVCLVHF